LEVRFLVVEIRSYGRFVVEWSMTLNPVDEYIVQYEGVQKEWLQTFVAFMLEPISYHVLTFKFGEAEGLHAVLCYGVSSLETTLPRFQSPGRKNIK
jgi:hypothetical protein